ncbi:MAG: hypothetical protein ACR2GD_04720 [Pyrinomonadaceae bacterium]
MAKEVITVDGEDKVVRADTAKSYRGTIWALVSIIIFIAILAILALSLGFFSLTSSSDRKNDSPANIENSTRR